MAPKFSFKDIPSLANKVAIVTGASAGIGLITARELAKKQCHVILACRSKAKTEPVVQSIAAIAPDAKVEFMELDLMSLKSVHAFSEAFKTRNLPLHILINNAGIMAPPFALSADGFESQFATNHIGHMALTLRLLPVLERSAPSRIVVVSSAAHNYVSSQGINLDTLNDARAYSAWTWYGQSKLANILFARELDRRLAARGISNVFVNTLHPGVIVSELMRHTNCFVRLIMRPFQMSTEDGAKTQLYAATHPDIEQQNLHGKFFVPIARVGESNALGQDEALAKRLWEFTEAAIAKCIGPPPP
ncbi:hypothetical protein H310_01073 [Aphanomyces invadans]|uniref:Uncharacterized protein n=1 Tax=Aphanomyces invadans TaxID=157072 RepID=A0A024USA3_9STRA|nr:hypothetical protein H310_01073 [Aphanomyces invadans]ETW08508.1 hypothetical protein H310_01073 [Aphanomyces invadans]|eukprot:XP_008862313.1 hypothetical protein H310_01073 [Aphanomyces invadans]